MPGRRIPSQLTGNVLIGRTTEVRVERIVAGGYGLARALGRTIFVAGAAPGERLIVRFDRTPGTIAFASVVDIVEPSPVRVRPAHPALGVLGADFQHLSDEAQLAAKQAIVAECFRRIGGLTEFAPPPITPSPLTWGYRSRAEWQYAPASGALGYIASGSREVVDLAADPLVVPALATAFAELRSALVSPAADETIRSIRSAAGDTGVSLAPPLLPVTAAPVRTTVRGETYVSDASCFFQANLSILPEFMAEALWAVQHLAPPPVERPLVELYAGVGLFTVPLARLGRRLVAVEGHAASANFAAENLAQVPAAGVQFVASSVEDWIADAYRTFGRPPLLLVNPPRSGLTGAVLTGVRRLRPEWLTYVACDPATLARDVKRLLADGYRLERTAAFDMFPQTHHVEVIAHLIQGEAR